MTALVCHLNAREPRKHLLGRGRSPRRNKRFRGSEGHLSELVHTREVTIPDLVHTRLRALAVNFNSFHARGLRVPSTNYSTNQQTSRPGASSHMYGLNSLLQCCNVNWGFNNGFSRYTLNPVWKRSIYYYNPRL